jgi:hypothetical protein
LAWLKDHPGWPGKPGVRPTDGVQLEEGVSPQSRFYFDAQGPLLSVTGDSPDVMRTRDEWDSFVWDPEVPILTVVISATGNDSGLQFCRPAARSQSGVNLTAPVQGGWPGWDDYEERWRDYCQSGSAVQSVSSERWSEWLEYVLSRDSCKKRLNSGGLVDVLLLGCFTHRAAMELKNRDLSFARPGSIRLVAFKDTIPTDACMVALYCYRLASTTTAPAAFEQHVFPAIYSGLRTFQQIHQKWRDVDESQTSYASALEETVMMMSLPPVPAKQ